MISFVGAGPGAPDLITLRGAQRLDNADIVIWASSLVTEAMLTHCKRGVETFESRSMTLEDVTEIYAAHPHSQIVRLHSGDPSIYGAIAEQISWCVANARDFEIVPGVTSLAAAAAAARVELTVPGLSQSVVLTRLADRTASSLRKGGEAISAFAAHGVTMALFLSAGQPRRLQDELLGNGSGFCTETPVVIAYRVTRSDEIIIRTKLGTLASQLQALGYRTTVLVLVGNAVGTEPEVARSHVYAPNYSHSFRGAVEDQRDS